jgi:hypothetical protein
MRKFLIAATLWLPASLAAQCSSSLVSTGVNGGAEYVVFMPQPITCYNGDIILYAHGYVPPGAPPDAWLTQLGLPD